jgi:hypothetical protein
LCQAGNLPKTLKDGGEVFDVIFIMIHEHGRIIRIMRSSNDGSSPYYVVVELISCDQLKDLLQGVDSKDKEKRRKWASPLRRTLEEEVQSKEAIQ